MRLSPRLRLARRIQHEIRAREGRNLVAFGVYGSVARGEDRMHSDLDLVLVLRKDRPGPRFLVRDGTLVTILRLTRDEAWRQVTEGDAGTPERLAGWRSVRPLDDPGGLLRRLRARARRPPRGLFREAARQGFLAAYEDLGKLRNAVEARDRDEAREMAIWFTGGAMLILFSLNDFVPSTDRRLGIDVRRFGRLGSMIRALRYRDLPLRRTSDLAESIWRGLLVQAARRGVDLPPALGR